VPHTVQPGETLWSIAAANNLTTRTVAAYNGLSEDAQVVLGSTLQIPTTVEGYAALQQQGLVREGDASTMALTAWSLVHGLAMLALDGQLSGRARPSAEELTLEATELLMFGMAAR
jgi:LysM repeat protein